MRNNRVIVGINDLATVNPALAREWHFTKNGDLTPFDVTKSNGKKVWWLGQCGHEWRASVNERNNGHGCPYCFGQKVLKGFNDLATTNPELAKEWHPAKNGDLTPFDVRKGSNKKIWWLGKCGHEWQAIINDRSGNNKGCPYCLGRRVLKGFNDLATTNPKLAEEWHPTKNGGLTPNMVTKGSKKKVWWKCDKGHEWQATLSNRDKGSKCPICKQESKTSFAEQVIYYYLKNQYPDTVNRDVSLGRELDIYIPSLHLGVEYDGYYYHQNLKRDKQKNAWFQKKGIRLIRVREQNCPKLDNCEVIIRNGLDDSSLYAVLIDLMKLLNVDDYSIDIERDRYEILNMYVLSQKEMSLFNQCSELAKEWHPTKNGGLMPQMVPKGSHKKIWWLGKCGHEWQSMVNDRNSGYGCPYCAGRKVLKGFNDLATVNPELAKEWHPTKNGDLTPFDVVKNSEKRVWWLGKCGHEWSSTIVNRNTGYGCPYCAGKKALKGFNDLATINPELAKEWHPTKNGDLTIFTVTKSSGKKVWWLGKCGHEWVAAINNRNKGNGCPYCAGQKVLIGFNDLATTNFELAKEWHPTKNGGLTPFDVTKSSGEEVWWLGRCGHEWQMAIGKRDNAYGCPYCSSRRVLKGFNDLATINPELAKEWHPTKNGGLTSFDVTKSSGKKVWWLGKCGHEWQMTVNKRYNGNGCPYCAGKKTIKGFNDLATVDPELAKEWHPTKNSDLTIFDVTKSSNKKVWWLGKCGHEWTSCIVDRENGTGCPYCAGKKVLKGFNDLATVNPKLVKEWHPTKNGDLTPYMVTKGSHKKVWWKCDKGHEWTAMVKNRIYGRGCPFC